MIYFIRCPLNGFVKIGFTSKSVGFRFRCICGCSPIPLKLIGATPGGKTLEAQIHYRFARYREHGEWFRPSDEIDEYISEVATPVENIFMPRRMKVSRSKYESHAPGARELAIRLIRQGSLVYPEISERTGLSLRSLFRLRKIYCPEVTRPKGRRPMSVRK